MFLALRLKVTSLVIRHCGIIAATASPPTDTKAMMKAKALVAWMFRQDMVVGADRNQGREESSCLNGWNEEVRKKQVAHQCPGS